MSSASPRAVSGQLILEDRVAAGQLTIDGEQIVDLELSDDEPGRGPLISPGFVDVHVHGWGGHDAMGGRAALDGMARALLARGVTSFLPTAVTAPLDRLERFAADVRAWVPNAPADGAQPLGFNLEGPFLAEARRGAHDAQYLLAPAAVGHDRLELMVDGLRVVTVAPELDGALDLVQWLSARGVAVSVGHSAATLEQARAAYAAGARSTTHLFNAMTGLDHRAPGVALAALLDDEVYVELIADGIHVHPALWPLIARLKPVDRLLAVSDAIALAGTGDGRGQVGGLDVEVVGGRATLAGTQTLAGSVIGLDTALRMLVAAGLPVPAAVAAVAGNPLALLGVSDRGRLAPGQRADLVELDDALRVRRVMLAGEWIQ